MIKDSFGGMEELSSKMRNQVKKSFKTYAFKKVGGEEVKSKCYEIVASAQKSYKIHTDVVSKKSWLKWIDYMMKADNFDFWVAYELSSGNPVALAINKIFDDCCDYQSMKCNPVYMHNSTYPYYGLIYEMNRYYLNERGVKYVCDGARSITEHSNIQPFLIDKFHFRKAYCQLEIVYKWYVGIIVVMLYPFRKLIKHSGVTALLNLEAMARGEL